MSDIKLALVGCGAIAETHASALKRTSGTSCTALYDVDRARAGAFAATYFPTAKVVDRLEDLSGLVNGAVVAVPNAYHAPTTLELLKAKVHVLCEKPLALTTSEAEAMVEQATRSNVLLGCGLVRRFFASTTLVSDVLKRRILGRPVAVDARESVFNWPLGRASFDKEISGGGSFIDIGPHLLDLLQLWFGPGALVDYADDAEEGVEAVGRARLRYGGQNEPVEAEIWLSRAYRNVNRIRITCTGGEIEIEPHRRDRIRIAFADEGSPLSMVAEDAPDPFVAQLQNFVEAIKGKSSLVAPASQVLGSIKLIESCYRRRGRLRPLRQTTTISVTEDELPYRKILVTGATGSVGSRFVELWAERAPLDRLRCLIRSHRTAARLKRFAVDIAEGDLKDADAVLRSARGCDAIVHLAVGEEAARETQTLVTVARKLGIRRFIHMSSAAVYGRSMPAMLEAHQDQTPLRRTGEAYADEKGEAERVVRAAAGALEPIVLRPHMVYGPGLRWSGELIELLGLGEVPVIEDGGWCNLIYVDDLCEAVRLGLMTRSGFDTPMFITDGTPIRWSDYILSHADLLGVTAPRVRRSDVMVPTGTLGAWIAASVRPIPALLRSTEMRSFILESPAMQSTLLRLYLKLREQPMVSRRLRQLRSGTSGSQQTGRYDQVWIEQQLSEARLSPARAEAQLGFRARVSFPSALEHSAEWFSEMGYDLRGLDISNRSQKTAAAP